MTTKSGDATLQCLTCLAQQTNCNAEHIQALALEVKRLKAIVSQMRVDEIFAKQLTSCIVELKDGSTWMLKQFFGKNAVVKTWEKGDALVITKIPKGTWTTHSFVMKNVNRNNSTYCDPLRAPPLDPNRYIQLN